MISMNDKDYMQRELMRKLAEFESKHKRRLPPDDIHLRLRRDIEKDIVSKAPAVN